MKNIYLSKLFKALSILCFTFLSYHSTLIAQESVSASGGNASGSGGSVSYTVGQVFYETITGSNGFIIQGVQQPYEISVVTGREDISGIDLICTVYPNPTTDILILKVDDSFIVPDKQYLASLYDINGKLLLNKKITVNETSIPMNEFVPGIYLLKVYQTRRVLSQQEIKTFQIIKN